MSDAKPYTMDEWDRFRQTEYMEDCPPSRVEATVRALDAAQAEVTALRAKLETTENELERERMRLAACGVVAMSNTPDSAARARDMLPEYRSASCDDVARAVDEQMRLRARVAELERGTNLVTTDTEKRLLADLAARDARVAESEAKVERQKASLAEHMKKTPIQTALEAAVPALEAERDEWKAKAEALMGKAG